MVKDIEDVEMGATDGLSEERVVKLRCERVRQMKPWARRFQIKQKAVVKTLGAKQTRSSRTKNQANEAGSKLAEGR